jgi:hypothetical protein
MATVRSSRVSRAVDLSHATRTRDRAFDERSSWLVSLNVEPLVDSIRDDRRFADLVRRVGLLS